MALPKECFIIPKYNYKKNIKYPSGQEIDNFLNNLGFDRTYLTDRIIDADETTTYICDYCEKECYGDVYRYKFMEYINRILNGENKQISTYYIKDMCRECKKSNISIQENEIFFEIDSMSKYHKLSYDYTIEALMNIADNEYLYVVKECSFGNTYNVDIHYYLKYYKNGKIYLDHELQTHSPYFGCDIIDLELNNNIAKITYNEKHYICEVTLEFNYDNSHEIFLKSKPRCFSRSQNVNTKNHEIGKIIKFTKNGVISESNTYF